MSTQAEKAARFLDLHVPGTPLLLPNAWDLGSLRLFASMGFHAIATTSSGYAATLGRLDGTVTLAEAHAHNVSMAAGTDVPVSSDYENCYSEDLAGVAENARLAVEAGLAGFSIEDSIGDGSGLYPFDVAVARVKAATDAAHAGDAHVVVTARTESALGGDVDFDDIIPRIVAFRDAGADVIYVPGLVEHDDITRVVEATDAPVNVLMRPGGPDVAQLADLGVARISVGGSFAYVALGAAADAARELLDSGTFSSADLAVRGGRTARAAFG